MVEGSYSYSNVQSTYLSAIDYYYIIFYGGSPVTCLADDR